MSDTGVGIAADKQGLLFEKFSQVDASSTRRFGGTGLGLAIARQLTELMGGRIGVVSEEGRGTTFWFTVGLEIGVETAPEKRETAAKTDAAPSDIHGARILVVDDNETNRQVLMTQLRAWSFRVREAADGPSALALLREAREAGIVYRAAILDMQMPGMDGVALAQVIRNEPAYAAMRMILLTSMGHAGESRRFKQAGFSAWLTKPVRASALFDTLHEALAVGAAQPDEVKPVPEVRPPIPSDAARVLLVEDNEVNRLVAEGMLRALGVRTDAAGNGADALAALKRTPYDLILMDVQMPVMDGLEATRRIREFKLETLNLKTPSTETGERSERNTDAVPPVSSFQFPVSSPPFQGPRLPIIAMTAHAMQGDREKCLDAGMDDYIAKPISVKALAAVLAKWLGTDKVHYRTKGDTHG